ncbi:MAG: preprotein translocase subunit YajC [Chitinophagales bacterium]|nr:preprotein translocase subunit YajC [Chitinophagaceae bacterium]MCB9064236.1 preprotein translocase subunit YajC [Chitinophagales bacterium]
MLVNLQTVFLQAQGNPMYSLLFMVGMIAVMYFFLIRPQAKRAKDQKKFSESIAVGERIVTNGGIHGLIKRANEDGTLQIEVHHGSFLTIERTAISMELTSAHRKKAGVETTDKK